MTLLVNAAVSPSMLLQFLRCNTASTRTLEQTYKSNQPSESSSIKPALWKAWKGSRCPDRGSLASADLDGCVARSLRSPLFATSDAAGLRVRMCASITKLRFMIMGVPL